MVAGEGNFDVGGMEMDEETLLLLIEGGKGSQKVALERTFGVSPAEFTLSLFALQ